MPIKNIPRDISTFETLISGGYIYVDKTEIINSLYTTGDRYHFFARPRRFGKSLLISTLKELFLGNRELFSNLWIGKSAYPFISHPVIHLDFSTIAHRSSEDLETSLHDRLDEVARLYALKIEPKKTFEDKMNALVKELAHKEKVVLLVDEYDHPLLKNINNLEIAHQNREILKSFYDVVKGLDAYWHAIFITGISKFSKTSIFSGLNNLNDISEKPIASTLLGYTESELITYFRPHIESMAEKMQVSFDEILLEMKVWYNGYRFSSEDIKVYNPFSVNYYLKDQNQANYWFQSATPTFLISLLKQQPTFMEGLENKAVSFSTLGAFDIENIPPITLLYQTGYLTIKEYDKALKMVVLAYPNEEVRLSASTYVLTLLTHTEKSNLENVIFYLRQALINNDIKEFCTILQSLLANIPYNLHIPKESYYHSLFHFLGDLLGMDIQSEVMSSTGRIDLVLSTKNRTYVMELKFNETSKKALEQIHKRRYFEKYLNKNKAITLVGMSFTFKDKKLVLDCIAEDLNVKPL